MANIEAKQSLVEDIKSKIQNAKSAVIIDYKGLTVEQDTAMRKELRENDVEYKVLKNTLVKRALSDLNIEGFDEDLNGPTAIAFSYKDEVSAAKIIAKNVDKTKKISIKSGIMDGKRMTDANVKSLATIPAKEVLLAQLLFTMQAPIQKLAIALNAISQNK